MGTSMCKCLKSSGINCCKSKQDKEVITPLYNLLSETKLLEDWKSPCDITSICPTTDGWAWTSDNISNTLILLDAKGEIKQKLRHTDIIDENCDIADISLSPTTNTLWACDWDYHILEIVSGQLLHRFKYIESPRCICVTASNHVILGMVQKRIKKFTTKGKLLLSSADIRREHQFMPYRITECPITQNLAVANSDIGVKVDVGVIVVDKNFNELFVYNGEVPDTYQPLAQSEDIERPFDPCGVAYDSVGNLVIGDKNNSRVLLISGHGDFLRILHTDPDKDKTLAVGIDREDVLWAVFSKGVISIYVKQLEFVSTNENKEKNE